MFNGISRVHYVALVLFMIAASFLCRILQPSLRTMTSVPLSYLGQKESQDIDVELFDEYKFSVDQLMELAGLAVATAVSKSYPERGNVLVVCGPGNNGGDGLVAARHLALWGFTPHVVYPKQPNRHPFVPLLHQVKRMNIGVSTQLPDNLDQYTFILDAVFGFSFKGDIRAPFDTIISALIATETPVASVDVPSGWDVEQGNAAGLQPDVLISLTAPKLCARYFKGRQHWLGGRFVPPALAAKYNMVLPEYPGSDQVVLI